MDELVDRAGLAAVIVNHEDGLLVGPQLAGYFRDSAELFQRTHWSVVHNGREPPPALTDPDPRVAKALAQVEVHCCENHGYAAAINAAARRNHRPFLLALNADLVPEPGFLPAVYTIARELAGGGRTGIVGATLLNPDGSAQGSCGHFPSLARVLAGLAQRRSTRKYSWIGSPRPQDVPWVSGACFLIARRCLDEVGPLDERFFMYYEDVDLCWRAWDAGWQVRYDPRMAVRHLHPYHSRTLTAAMAYQARRALLLYFFEHRPAHEFRMLTRIVRWECRLRRFQGPWGPIHEMVARVIQDPHSAWGRPAQMPND